MATKVVNGGLAIITNRMKGSGTEPLYVGWGTGAGTTAVANTDLFTPANEARVAGTSSRVTTTVTNDTYQVVGTITSLSAQTITNAGLFDGAGSGTPPSGATLYLKGDFAGVALALGDSIQFTIQTQFTN